MIDDPLKLTADQQKIIESALASVDRLRERIVDCDKAKLFQLAARYRRMAMELEETIQLQIQEIRFDSFPSNWSTEDRLKLLGTSEKKLAGQQRKLFKS